MAEEIDPIAPPFGEHVGEDVDADMLVGLEGPRRAQHEDRAEQIPLEFEPGIGRHAEDATDDGIDRRHQDRHHDRPGERLADPFIEGVDGAGNPEEHFHPSRPLTLYQL